MSNEIVPKKIHQKKLKLDSNKYHYFSSTKNKFIVNNTICYNISNYCEKFDNTVVLTYPFSYIIELILIY